MGKNMKIYNIFTTPNENNIFVEESFSWKAFLFQIFWLLYHKIWMPAALIILIYFSLGLLLQKNIISENLLNGLHLVISLIIANFAKTWYIDALKSQNYQQRIIAAKSLDEAKLTFFKEEYNDI